MKTRYAFFLMLTAWLSVFSVQTSMAQAKQDALYIYRNDGGFHGFFYDEIDRIEYSKIDTLGVEHDDYVTQEIYALDTLYRIPISAIDSVGFVTPENVYKKDVAHTDESDLWNYVISCDSVNTLLLAANTPANLIPRAGDKLVTLNQIEALPSGFMGKVTDVTTAADGITVKCDYLDLTDVYDQFVIKIRTIEGDGLSRTHHSATRGDDVGTLYAIKPGFSTTLDFADGYLAKLGPILMNGKLAKLGVDVKNNITVRGFINVLKQNGVSLDITLKHEMEVDLKENFNASLTLRLDIPLAMYSFGKGFKIAFKGGVTTNISSSLNMTMAETHKTGYTATMKVGNSASLREAVSNLIPSIEIHDYRMNGKIEKMVGSGSFSIGAFGAVSLMFTVFDLATIRPELGYKLNLSADFYEEDNETLLPAIRLESPTAIYDLLNRDGSIKGAPYFSVKLLRGIGALGVIGGYAVQDLDYLGKEAVDKFLEKYQAFNLEEGVVPRFSMPVLAFDEKTRIPTATSTVGRKTVNVNPVGFAVYYKESRKRLGEPVWKSEPYYYNKENDQYSFKEYSLELPKFGGGKEVEIYPATKLLGIELLASPSFSYKVSAELKSAPDSLFFEADGGKQTFTVTDNLDHDEDVYISDFGWKINEKDGDWISVTRKDDRSYDFTVTVKPNDTENERRAEINVNVYNADKDPSLELIVPVIQKAADTRFAVSPDTIKVPGYSKDFRDGQLTQQLTVTYPMTGSVKMTSSDDTWLKIDDDWVDKKDDKVNYTATRNIRIQANTSLDTSREGTITVELTKADGTTDTKTVIVRQIALELQVEFEPGEVILSAGEEGSSYSEKRSVIVKRTPYDDYIAAAINDEVPKPNDEWIEATLVGNTIEVRALVNPVEEDRSNTVTYTITMKDGSSVSYNFKVTQQKKMITPPFTTSPKEVRFTTEGGEMKVSIIGENVKRIKEIDCMSSKWLGGAASGTTVTLLAQPNPDEEERVGTVYLTVEMNDGSMVWHYFLVYQDGTNTGELPEGWPTREVVDHLVDQGMPIHYGDEPPTLNGVYELSPYVTIASYSDSERGAASMVVRLISQSDGTIKFNSYSTYADGNKDGVISISTDSGKKEYDVTGYMMGSDGKFSIAIPIAQLKANANWPAGTFGMVISGEKDGDTIRNLYISETHFSSTSLYGIVKDGDGVSNHTVWNPYVDDEE